MAMLKLSDAIRDVKNAAAERGDVVVEMREAARMRLEFLVHELQPVIDDIDPADDWFDFALSSGEKPRFWIDATAHICMGRDRRTYRFLKDTRLGRTVLAESTELRPVADQVTRYVAERLVERERIREGDVELFARDGVRPISPLARARASANGVGTALAWILLGAGIGIAVFIALYRDQLPL